MAGGRRGDRRRLERRGWAERTRDAVRWRLGQRPGWHVAVARGDWRGVDLSRGSALPSPPGGYLADPFLCEHDGRVVLFAEEYRWVERRGIIAAYDLTGDAPSRIGEVLREPFHLSFPSIFAFDGAVWMTPECSEAGGLRLYRCTSFPRHWELEAHWMEGEALADPLIFERDGRWWLLANRPDPGGKFTGRLCAWHAGTPLGPWIEHGGNPVVLDRERGRNGGIVWADGVPHRVGQRQGADVYGRGLGIYRIDELGPDTYRETAVARVGPDFLPGIRGAHHMSHAGGWTAWDYSRWAWPER